MHWVILVAFLVRQSTSKLPKKRSRKIEKYVPRTKKEEKSTGPEVLGTAMKNNDAKKCLPALNDHGAKVSEQKKCSACRWNQLVKPVQNERKITKLVEKCVGKSTRHIQNERKIYRN